MTHEHKADPSTTGCIVDLIKPDQPARLQHPICGLVDWAARDPGEGLILIWATGIDKGRPLVVDDTVLFDDQWSLRSPNA